MHPYHAALLMKSYIFLQREQVPGQREDSIYSIDITMVFLTITLILDPFRAEMDILYPPRQGLEQRTWRNEQKEKMGHPR